MWILLCLAAVSAVAPVLKNCGTKTLFTLNTVSLSPANPVPNENVILHIGYTVPTGVSISAGEARYAVTYNFIPLTPTVQPLCSVVACPLTGGVYTNDTMSVWPSGLIGKVVTKITWVDTTSQALLCVSMTASF